jgi:hypothetical protein
MMAPASDTERSPKAATAIADLEHALAREQRAVLTRRECQSIGGWGATSQVEKEKSGALVSILDGATRKITTESLYRHLIALALASYPANAPAAKGRKPKSGFRKKLRARTEAELRGLAIGNARRREEARARRERREIAACEP